MARRRTTDTLPAGPAGRGSTHPVTRPMRSSHGASRRLIRMSQESLTCEAHRLRDRFRADRAAPVGDNGLPVHPARDLLEHVRHEDPVPRNVGCPWQTSGSAVMYRPSAVMMCFLPLDAPYAPQTSPGRASRGKGHRASPQFYSAGVGRAGRDSDSTARVVGPTPGAVTWISPLRSPSWRSLRLGGESATAIGNWQLVIGNW